MVRVMVKIFLAPKIEKMTLTSTKLFYYVSVLGH